MVPMIRYWKAAVTARRSWPKLTSTEVESEEISRKTKILKASPVITMPSRPVKVSRNHAVEEVDPLFFDFRLDADIGVREDDGADCRYDHENEGVDAVDPVLDAPGRQPVAQLVGNRPGCQYLHQQHDRDGQRRP